MILERFNFHARVQRPGESITAFLADLRSLIVTCDFPDQDNMLRDRLVMGVAERATQRALLREADLTLSKAVDIALSEEASARDQQSMGGVRQEEAVSAVSPAVPPSGSVSVGQCRFCARSHEMRRSLCPAWGKKCNACGGRNHFSVCCRPGPAAAAARQDRGAGRRAGNSRSAGGDLDGAGRPPSQLFSAGGRGSVGVTLNRQDQISVFPIIVAAKCYRLVQPVGSGPRSLVV